MECPACGNQMQEVTVGDVKVDVCKGGCGGVWFDQFELKKFDEPHKSAGAELLDVERSQGTAIDRTKKLNCPRCGDFKMLRHFFSVKHEVEVDECPNCAGYWLDAGELRGRGCRPGQSRQSPENREHVPLHLPELLHPGQSELGRVLAARLAGPSHVSHSFRLRAAISSILWPVLQSRQGPQCRLL